MARAFGLAHREEARAYLAHAILGLRRILTAKVMADSETSSAELLMGRATDAKKLCASMTLFSWVAEDGAVFRTVLATYFDDHLDQATLDLLA